MVLATINVGLMATLLGPRDFGYFSIIIAIASVILIPADFGLTTATVKFLSEKKFPVNHIINTAIGLKFLIFFIILLIYFSLLLTLKDIFHINSFMLRLYLYYVPLVLLGDTMYRLSLGIFQGSSRVDLMAYSSLALRGLQLFMCGGLVILGLGVAGASIGYGLASFLVFLISTAFFRMQWSQKPVMHVAKSLLGFSSYTFLSLTMYVLILWTDLLVISIFYPAEYVGYYSIASKAAILVTTIPVAIEAVLYPTISAKYRVKDTEGTREIFIKAVKIIFYAAGLSSIAVIIVSYFGITLFFPEYAPAILPLIILTASFFIGSFGYAYVSLLNGWNQPKIPAKITAIQALINLILNLLFVPSFGYVAASITSLISFAIGTYLGLRSVESIIGGKVGLSDLKIHKEEITLLNQKIKKLIKGNTVTKS